MAATHISGRQVGQVREHFLAIGGKPAVYPIAGIKRLTGVLEPLPVTPGTKRIAPGVLIAILRHTPLEAPTPEGTYGNTKLVLGLGAAALQERREHRPAGRELTIHLRMMTRSAAGALSVSGHFEEHAERFASLRQILNIDPDSMFGS